MAEKTVTNKTSIDKQLTTNNNKTKRTRLTQACIVCHNKKIKCDGTKPQCLNCVAHSEDCNYPEFSKKRGPKVWHYEAIERRINHLESKIDKLYNTLDNNLNNTYINNNDISPKLDKTSTSNNTVNSVYFSSPLLNSNILNNQITYVTKDVSLMLLQAYFKHYHHMYPMLHPSTFFIRLNKNEIPNYLLFSMYATAAKYTCLKNVNQPYLSGEPFEKLAYNEINKLKQYNLDSLVAMIILAKTQYEMGHANRGWLYSGMAVRMAYLLRASSIDNKSNKDENNSYFGGKSEIEKEIGRRTWWVIYCSDTFVSAATNNHPAVQESDDVCNFPNESMQWNANLDGQVPEFIKIGNVEPLFTLHIKLFLMIKSILKFRTRLINDKDAITHFNAINTALRLWREKLPCFYEIKENFNSDRRIPFYLKLSLHALYNALVIMLNSTKFAITLNRGCFELCINAANNISNLVYEGFVQDPNQVLPFYVSYCLYMSSKIIITNNQHLSWDELNEQNMQFSRNLQILKAHSMSWGLSNSYLQLLYYYYTNYLEKENKTHNLINSNHNTKEESKQDFIAFYKNNIQGAEFFVLEGFLPKCSKNEFVD